MAQIRAYKLGDQIESLKQQVDSKYALASDDKKALINAIRKSYENYLAADELSGRDAQRLWLDAYTRMNNILDDKEAYSPSSVETAYKNMFGRYSKGDIGAIGNKITRDTLESATEPGNSSTSATIETSTGPAHYNWNGTSGVDSSWYNSNTTNKQRALDYIDGLSARLLEAKAALSEKRIMHGITITPEEIDSYLQRLQALKGANWDSEDITSLNAQVEELKNISRKLKIQPEEFSMFFKPWYQTAEEEEEQTQTNPTSNLDKALRDAGYDGLYDLNTYNPYVKSYLDQRGWHLTGKNGITYVIDDQGNLIKLGQHQIDTDSKSGTYKQGLFISPEGTFWSGDVLGTIDPNNPFAGSIAAAIKAELEKSNGTADTWSINENTEAHNEDALILKLKEHLQGKNFKYTDFSNKFFGDKAVVGVRKSNPDAELSRNEFGYLQPDNDTVFYYLDDDGNIKEATFDEMTQLSGGYNYRGYEHENPIQLHPSVNLDEDLIRNAGELTNQLEASLDEAGRWWRRGHILKNEKAWFSWILKVILDPYGESTSPIMGTSDINHSRVLRNLGFYDNKKEFIEMLYNFMHDNGIKLEGEDLNNWRKVRDYYNSMIRTHKTGGVLYAKLGQSVSVTGLEVDPNRPLKSPAQKQQEREDQIMEEKGYETKSQMQGAERTPTETGWNTSDVLRVCTVAADVIGAVTAMFPGWGTAASAGISALSTGTNFVLDITEDGFQFSDLKNLAVNAGLDIVGLIGGAGKLAKASKGIIKLAPVLIGAFSTMLNGAEYADIVKKLQRGKRLTVREWQLIGQGLSLVAGASRMGSAMYKQKVLKTKLDIVNSGKNTVDLKTKKGEVAVDRDTLEKAIHADTKQDAENILNTGRSDADKIEVDGVKSEIKLFKPSTWFGRTETTANPLKDMKLPESTAAKYTNEQRQLAYDFLTKGRYAKSILGPSDVDIYLRESWWPKKGGVSISEPIMVTSKTNPAPGSNVTPLNSLNKVTPSNGTPASNGNSSGNTKQTTSKPRKPRTTTGQTTNKISTTSKTGKKGNTTLKPQILNSKKSNQTSKKFNGGYIDLIINPTPTWLKPLNI